MKREEKGCWAWEWFCVWNEKRKGKIKGGITLGNGYNLIPIPVPVSLLLQYKFYLIFVK